MSEETKVCPLCEGRGWLPIDLRAVERCMPKMALAITAWSVVCYYCDGKREVPKRLQGDKDALLN